MPSFTVPPLARLIEQLERLPGIGHKSAQRLAFYLLNLPEKNAADFVAAITDAREKIHECAVCRNLTDQELCPVCRAGNRDTGLICVVEDPRDVMALSEPGVYRPVSRPARHHFPMDGVGPGAAAHQAAADPGGGIRCAGDHHGDQSHRGGGGDRHVSVRC